MEFIAHRINTIKELKQLPTEFGVELDLRDFGNDIIIAHDPFKKGEHFKVYLKNYRHQTMILNIKSEAIEYKVLELIKKYRIKKYFLLDSSFPMIVKFAKLKERNIAVRFSEYESLETILKMKGKVSWVWVDCFNKFSLSQKEYLVLRKSKFKLCLVSPELQGRPDEIDMFSKIIRDRKIVFDAICTKHYNVRLWKKLLS